MPDAIVDIDSDDSRLRRLDDSETLRGGSEGVCRGVALRGGGRGGRTGDIFGDSCTISGWFPSCRADVDALLRTGGLLTD
jgi:hypothetical protein